MSLRAVPPFRWVKDGASRGRIRYGADYNPDQWSRDVWQDDVRLMRAAGVNIVSLGIFSWAAIEPADGEWDFTWLDEIMDLLHEHGIDVDLATATASPPPWLTLRHPEILPTTRDGAVLSPGGRQHWRPTSPVFRERALKLVRALAGRYGQHPALVAWHISNELGCHNVYDYSDDAAAAFRVWLRERYTTIDALNDAWGTAFWSQRYGSWHEILPPRSAPTQLNPGQQLDFERFSSDALRDYLRAENAVLAELTPDVPRTTNFMVTDIFNGVDYTTWVDDVDFISNDHYLSPSTTGRDELSLAANLTGNLAQGRPWFLMEHATSAVNWRPVNHPKAPGELARDALTHVAHGADAVCFFQWRQSRAGGERYHSAMVPHAGEDSQVFRDVCALGARLGRLHDITGSTRVPARVAVLHDWPSWWVSGRDSHPSERIDYAEEVQRWYTALLDEGIRADVVPAAWDFSDYEVIIAPMLHVVPDALRVRIEDAVRSGVHVITTYFSGIVDGNDRVHLGGYPGAFSDLAGVRVEEFSPLGPEHVQSLASGATAHLWSERITSIQPDVSVLDRYVGGALDGAAAITRRTVGEGSMTYVSADIGVPGARWLLQSLAMQIAALVPDHRSAGGALEVVQRRGPDTDYTFLINRRPEPVSITATVHALDGPPVDRNGTITIEPNGVVVLATPVDTE